VSEAVFFRKRKSDTLNLKKQRVSAQSLAVLLGATESMTAGSVAKKIGCNRRAAGKRLKLLHDAGFANRTMREDRAFIYTITQAGSEDAEKHGIIPEL
jgi:predicted transcriptional regulator